MTDLLSAYRRSCIAFGDFVYYIKNSQLEIVQIPDPDNVLREDSKVVST